MAIIMTQVYEIDWTSQNIFNFRNQQHQHFFLNIYLLLYLMKFLNINSTLQERKTMSFFVYVPNSIQNYSSIQQYRNSIQKYNEENMENPSNICVFNSFNSFAFSYDENQKTQTRSLFCNIKEPTVNSIPGLLPEKQEEAVIESRKKIRCEEKQIKSAKKNSESNLINHFFSYFTVRERSQKLVQKTLDNMNLNEVQKQKFLFLFYNTIHVLNSRRGRKYINHTILKPLLSSEKFSQSLPFIKQKLEKFEGVPLQKLPVLFRKLLFHFYRNTNSCQILTSKRISIIAKKQHFQKKRKILDIMFQKKDSQ